MKISNLKLAVVCLSIVASLAGAPARAQLARGGIKTATGFGMSQTQGCTNAKQAASNMVPRDGQVTEYSECMCEENPATNTWTCSVDAKWTR